MTTIPLTQKPLRGIRMIILENQCMTMVSQNRKDRETKTMVRARRRELENCGSSPQVKKPTEETSMPQNRVLRGRLIVCTTILYPFPSNQNIRQQYLTLALYFLAPEKHANSFVPQVSSNKKVSITKKTRAHPKKSTARMLMIPWISREWVPRLRRSCTWDIKRRRLWR